VTLRLVPFLAYVQGGGQVAAQADFGTGEAAVHGGERGFQFVGGPQVADEYQAVTAPTCEMRLVQG
jgi:hypothetical protein